jgi:hypothetical protein
LDRYNTLQSSDINTKVIFDIQKTHNF